MEEMGESTSLRAEIQVLLDDPANFYNIVMSNSGKREGRQEHATSILMGGARFFPARISVSFLLVGKDVYVALGLEVK